MRVNAALQRMAALLIEPQVLFPVVATALVAAVWYMSLSGVHVMEENSRHEGAVASREMLNTYEAQVVRALREIDQTLNLVNYWHARNPDAHTLQDLKDHGLLPPALLFAVSIADRDGNLIDSTRPFGGQNVAQEPFFHEQQLHDTFLVAPLPHGATGDAQLQFTRRLSSPSKEFDGVIIVSVDATYFVSGYEAAKLGQHGVLGLIGADGIFRIRRTGDSVFSGDEIDYSAAVAEGDPDSEPTVSKNSWDGVDRWTSARELYGFPLAAIAAISVDEQLAPMRRERRASYVRATFGSVLVLVIAAALGRLSVQLQRSRRRESDTKLAHAQRIEYLAYHDGLTGLPNRSLCSKLLGQRIADANRRGERLAVAFLDLDRFKQINDTLGHEAGDQLLKEVATRLSGCVRETDTVARLGGDEFVVLLPELGDPTYAGKVANKILSVISEPFNLIGQEFRVTASVGISVYPEDGLDEQTLTKHADIAMYQAKEEGKNNFQFYSEELNANSLERLTLESSLRHALERGEFRLHYQAKRDISSGRVTGMEALLRWEHPELGTVAPMRFIPLAEETGLIVPIGKWVLKTACAQNVSWQAQGLPRLSIAVNLTARQFSDESLLHDIKSILATTGMEPSLLELEITESLLIHDVEKTLQILTRLKALGVRIAIDDFGTGYSSLASLQRFPVDTIKIDRSFIRDVSANNKESGLADAVIAMGKSLSLTVVAQGVETREQANFLRLHACDELQGFYFRKPLPADEFTELLQSQASGITFIGAPPRLSA